MRSKRSPFFYVYVVLGFLMLTMIIFWVLSLIRVPNCQYYLVMIQEYTVVPGDPVDIKDSEIVPKVAQVCGLDHTLNEAALNELFDLSQPDTFKLKDSEYTHNSIIEAGVITRDDFQSHVNKGLLEVMKYP